MKKFMIRLNGKSFEVEVEEITNGTSAAVSAPAPAVAQAAPTEKNAPSAPVTPLKPGPVSNNSEVIQAPMPGKLIAVMVKVGQTVKAGDLICTLEAMKMQNELLCGSGGTVKEIRAKEGTSVNTGDVLVVIG